MPLFEFRFYNLCSFKGLHLISFGDCWFLWAFLGNLFTYLLWEVMLSTITIFWTRQKNHIPGIKFHYFLGTFTKKIIKILLSFFFSHIFWISSPYDVEHFVFGTSCASLGATRPLTNTAVIANEQAERRREACEAASLMPREVLQQAEKFSVVL